MHYHGRLIELQSLEIAVDRYVNVLRHRQDVRKFLSCYPKEMQRKILDNFDKDRLEVPHGKIWSNS